MTGKPKFVYPHDNLTVKPASRRTKALETNATSPEPTPEDAADPVPTALPHLVEFIEKYLEERQLKKNPEAHKKQTAISAYKKVKKSA